jgi:hypothetical protein
MTACARRSTGHIAKERREVSESPVVPFALPDAVQDPESRADVAAPALVVISEREVMLSTAMAVGLPRAQRTTGVIATLRAVFAASSRESRPERRRYPPRRDSFVEQAAMAREMNTRWPRA